MERQKEKKDILGSRSYNPKASGAEAERQRVVESKIKTVPLD